MTTAIYNESTAHVIRDDNEAIAVAQALADEFQEGDSERDRQRRLPVDEVQKFSQSGLWGITVPKEYGGAFVSFETLTEVIKIISEADSSLGQIPQNHLHIVEGLRLDGSEEQKRFFFDQVLQGKRFGNAFSEIGTKHVLDVQTRLTRNPSGSGYVLNGRKFYSTGALFADWVPVVAIDESNTIVVAIVERDAEGLTIIDDWSSFGQRTTGSGTTVLENVEVPELHVFPHQRAFERPTTMGAVSQIIQAAVDIGIAKAALRDTYRFVRTYTRPWVDSTAEHGYDDPLLIYKVGESQIKVHAAEAILRRAGKRIDDAIANSDEKTVAEAQIAVAEAKAIAEDTAIWVTNKLFELAGTRATLAEFNLDRHWRNARTHTLHDPARWKYYAVGNYYLNSVNPPRHPWF